MGQLLLRKTNVKQQEAGVKRNENTTSGFILEERVDVAAENRVGAVAWRDAERSPEKPERYISRGKVIHDDIYRKELRYHKSTSGSTGLFEHLLFSSILNPP